MSTTSAKRPSSNGRARSSSSSRSGSAGGAAVELTQIQAETLLVPIIGTAPLVVHRFSRKAKQQMLDAMQGRKSPKEPKDPQAEYRDSLYLFTDGTPGFPAAAFKQATVAGARLYGKSAVNMKALKQCIFLRGDEVGEDGLTLVRIDGEHRMREDVVRLGRGSADLRYRAEFPVWTARLTVTYATGLLTRGSLLSLIDAGGMGCGVGEWRPEKNGDFGTYRVDPDRAVEVI